jgi:hypothetical protein
MRLEDILSKLLSPEWLSQPENDPDANPEMMGAGAPPPAMPAGMEGKGPKPSGMELDKIMGGGQMPQLPEGNLMQKELTPAQRKLRHLGRMSDLTKEQEQTKPNAIKTLLE